MNGRTVYEYDGENRPVKITRGTEGDAVTVRMKYDPMGRIVNTTDGEGNPSRVEYDVFGNETKVFDCKAAVSISLMPQICGELFYHVS